MHTEACGETLERRRQEALRYQAVLLDLGAQGEADFGTFLRRVLKSDATLLAVERVSFWVFEETPPAIRCVSLYQRETDHYDGGLHFDEADARSYFRALREQMLIVADDAPQDARTREFAESYLAPAGITSMLDVPVWVRGRLGGVVCHEHVGPPRAWQPEEQAFALSIGQLVSTGLEAEERRKAERALRESEERFALLARATPDSSIILLDPEGHIHAGAERIRGFRPEELLGQHVSVFYPPEDVERGRPERALRRALERGRDEEEGWMVRKDGSRFWARVVVTPLYTETGVLRGFACVARDLTERRLAHEKEQLLAETRSAEEQQRLLARVSATLVTSLEEEHILEGVAHLIVPVLADGCVVYLAEASGQGERVATVAAVPAQREALGQLAEVLTRPSEWGERLAAAFVQGHPAFLPRLEAHEVPALTAGAEGQARLAALAPCSAMLLPLTARRRHLGLMVLLRGRARQGMRERQGVRERQGFRERDWHLGEELARRAAYAVDNARLYQQAQVAIGLRDDFLSVAAHELRTPLAALRLHLEGLERVLTRRHVEGVSEGVRRKLESAGRQLTRLARLVDDLMEVSRISAGRLGLRREALDLAELVRDLVEDFHGEAERACSPLRVQAEAPVTGEWDPLRLEQVVTNLLSNALKFGRGQPVEVEVRQEGELARLVVRDHGIGIAREDQQRIFHRFERATSARHFGGLGLGLFVSQQIVEAHGGHIGVESEPGQGATFTVLLPRRPAEATRAPPGEPPRVLH